MADLSIIRGDDYRVVVTLTSNGSPFDLTGYTAKAQIRPSTSSSAPLTVEFTATVETPETDGLITLELNHADTALLTSNGVWDLEITDSSDWVTTVASGAVTIVPDVTRAV
jgi:hypothetical protein